MISVADHAERSRGFTAVELLTTAGVIVVLCALLFVAITKASVKAQRLQCVSNLLQHGKALNSFVGDQGKYPLFINPGVQFGLFPDHARSVTLRFLFSD